MAEAIVAALDDPSGLMGPIRAAGVMERFWTDLGNLDPPAEFRDRYDTLRAALASAGDVADSVLPAGQVSQEAVDDAIASIDPDW